MQGEEEVGGGDPAFGDGVAQGMLWPEEPATQLEDHRAGTAEDDPKHKQAAIMPAAGLREGDQEQEGGDDREIGAVVGAQVSPAPAEQRERPGHEGGAVDIITGERAGEDGGGDDHGFERQNGQPGPVIAPDIHHGDILGGGGDKDGCHRMAGEQAEDPRRGKGDGAAQRPGHVGGEH